MQLCYVITYDAKIAELEISIKLLCDKNAKGDRFTELFGDQIIN